MEVAPNIEVKTTLVAMVTLCDVITKCKKNWYKVAKI